MCRGIQCGRSHTRMAVSKVLCLVPERISLSSEAIYVGRSNVNIARLGHHNSQGSRRTVY